MNRIEYDNTVRDLTGVDIRPAKEFPVDPANEAGFDNSAESLAMSPALVNKYLEAAQDYRLLVEHFPTSPHFDDAIEAQFRIGELYLRGKKTKVLGVSIGSPLDRAVEIFAAIVRTAPYEKYTARAQFNIALAREKQDSVEAALDAYQAVIDKFPNESVHRNPLCLRFRGGSVAHFVQHGAGG